MSNRRGGGVRITSGESQVHGHRDRPQTDRPQLNQKMWITAGR
jgi:hypothetical protein